MPHKILLLGAGFSRNWGGYLAQEVDDYLLGSGIDPDVRDLLFRHRRSGGFEKVLEALQSEALRDSSNKERLEKFETAIVRMFEEMQEAFVESRLDRDGSRACLRFLCQFDAIFTLNQDGLLEDTYLNQPDQIALATSQRLLGAQLPGVPRILTQTGFPSPKYKPISIPVGPDFSIGHRLQPIYKLHGSYDWKGEGSFLVMGAGKSRAIEGNALLRHYFSTFRSLLLVPDTRLMVVGYSFRDDHINSVLTSAKNAPNFRMFIVDPLGLDVLDFNRNAPIYAPCNLISDLYPVLWGSSRRPFREIIQEDAIEKRRVERFLST